MKKAEDIGPVRPGDVIGGKYRVERELGAGGMGVVVAARHVQLGQLVAVKFLLPEAARRPEIVGRFLREAHASVRLKSEHVARVFDVGTAENGAPYLVMEYLEGSDLAAAVARGPLRIRDAVGYVLQVCDALQEAHAIGVVHRDIKPSNLFVTRRPNGTALVKLLDFGISKVDMTGESQGRITATTTVMGSPLYMSPEQMHSARSAEPRSDIWALGAVLYELLAGRTAFSGESLVEICMRVLSTEPDPLRVLRPEVPEELDAVVRRCLEKHLEQRFANVAELAAALAPFAGAEPNARLGFDTGPRVSTNPGAESGSRVVRRDVATVPEARPPSFAPPRSDAPPGFPERGGTQVTTGTGGAWHAYAPGVQRSTMMPNATSVVRSSAPPGGGRQSKAGVVAALAVGLGCAAALGLFLIVRGGGRAASSDPPAPAAIASGVSLSSAAPESAPVQSPSSEPSAADAGAKPSPDEAASGPKPALEPPRVAPGRPRARPKGDHEDVRK